MLKSRILKISLLIILALSATAHAKNEFKIHGEATIAPRTDVLAKDAQEVANLEVISFTGPATGAQGENLDSGIAAWIRNAGPDSIITIFNVSIFLSDTLGGSVDGDVRLGGRTFLGLAVTDTLVDFIQILVPLFADPGEYFLVLKLDHYDDVLETNETDNTASIPFTLLESNKRTVYYEDFQGGPAGWTTRDDTEQTDFFMQRIDYTVDLTTRGVWWCGDNNPNWVDSMGYGNRWDQRLEKTFDLPAAGPCSLFYAIQYDSEPGYDYTHVEISNTGGATWSTLTQYDGYSNGEFLSYAHDISTYAGDQVVIRFRFTSDGGWSDEDGDYLSDGAFRLDEVTVTGSPTDDFEIDGDEWTPLLAPPLGGEFRLEEVPYCPTGLVCDEYGTGEPGIFCNAWVAYDPATLEFPHSNADDHEQGKSIRIVVESPSIDISDAETDAQFVLVFDALNHPFENGVFYIWSVRDNLNDTWRDRNFVYFGHDRWGRIFSEITDLVTPGADSLQIQLGATDYGWIWGYEPPIHGPAPYLDNVELIIFDNVPPTIIDPGPRLCGWSNDDTDGDGVLNNEDLCLGETASFFDRDGDGCLDPIMGARHIEYWDYDAFPLSYRIHEGGAPGITDDSDFSAIHAGFNTWTTIPGAEITFNYGGTVSDGNADALDLVNMVTFADLDYPFPSGVLAVGLSTSYITPVWDGDGYRPGQIIDSDMIFNPAAKFQTATMGTGIDIQSVVTHEAGHMLGLSHSAVRTSTMFYVLPPDNQASQLATEDILAMFKAYPDQASVAGASHLRGTVMDGYTGDPVAGAIVFAIEALGGPAMGDTLGCDFTLPMDGSYHFLGLPDGAYFIAIHPLNGSSKIGYLQPGNINQMILDSAQTVFLPEFYDGFESNSDLADDRLPVIVSAGATTTIDLITNVDLTPPSVLQTSPAAGALDVSVNSALLIKFSEAMDPDSFLGNFGFIPSGGNTVMGNAALASDDSTLMFVPLDNLAFETEYILDILGGVRDLFGNTMDDMVRVTFTTESQPPVYIDNLVPSKAIAGSIVMINGGGFDSGVSSNSVMFGPIPAQILEATTDQIVVVVPNGPATGPVNVVVTNPNGNDTAIFNLLEPEDVARGHEIATVDLPSLPDGVVVSPDGDFAYVTTATGLAVIDITDRANPVLHFMDVQDGLDDLDVAPGGANIFAVSSGGQKLFRFHFDNAVLAPNNPVTLLSEIGLGGTPLGILVGPSGQRAYIAVEGGAIEVWDINASSSTFENQVGLFYDVDPNLLGDLEMDPSGDKLFALTGTGKLQVFDVDSASFSEEVTVQSNPVDVTIEPAGQYAYVTDGSGYLTVVSLSTMLVVADIPAGGDLRGAAVTPTGSFVYAANYEMDNLDVIDLRPNAPTFRNIAARIPARVNPLDLAFSPDGVFAYSLVEDESKFVVWAMGAGPILASASPTAGPVGAKVVLAGSGFTGATVTVDGIAAVIERATETAMTILIPAGAETGPLTVVGAVPGEVSNSLTFPVLEAEPGGGLRLAAALSAVGNPELEPVLAVSPVGGQLAVADAAGNIHLLDTRSGSSTYHQFTTVGGVYSSAASGLVFSPDGATVYAVSSGSPDLVVIDTAFGNSTYGQPLATVPMEAIDASQPTVSPDGSLVLVADPARGGVLVVDLLLGTVNLTTIPEGAVGAMAFHPGGAYAYLTVDAVDSSVLLVMDLTDPVDLAYGTITGTAVLPVTVPPEVPVSLSFTPDGSQCYVLTSQMAAAPNRSVVLLDTSNPAAPTGAATVGTFPTAVPPAAENLVLSPVGDRSVVSISGAGLFQASLDPWTAGALPEYVLAGPDLGMAYGREGKTFFVADPLSDQVLSFDFMGDQQLVPVWGEGQTGVVGEILPTPLRVRIVDQDDEGSSGVPVTFNVVAGGGYFSVSGDNTMPATLNLATDTYGYAQVDWALGATLGNQTVQVTSQGVTGSPWTYTATAISDPDSLPLELVSNLLAPAAGALDVSVTTAIKAVFTKAIDPTTIFDSSCFLYDMTDAAMVPIVYGFSDLNKNVSLTPVAPLDFGKSYQVSITASVKDPDGEVLTNPVVFVFATESPPVFPTLDSICPPSAVAVVGLVLAGTGFDPIPSGNRVFFHPEGGGDAVEGYISESATDFIRTTVPLQAQTGTVTVEVGGQTTNSLPFTVLVPATTSADDVIANVATGSATKSVTVSPDGALAYAVSPEADLLIPVDLGNLVSLPGIPVGDEPWAVTVHPEGTYVYVANRLSGDVSVVDAAAGSSTWHQVTNFIPVGTYPVDLVVAPTGDRVYVANSQSNNLSVIDTDGSSATFNSVIANVAIGKSAKSVTVSPDGGRIYIGTEDGYLVLGSLDYGVIAAVSTGKATKSVTVTPDGALLILIDTQGALTIYDIAPGSDSENQVIANVKTGAAVKSATVSPDGALLLVVLETGGLIEVYSIHTGTADGVLGPDATRSIFELQLIATLEAGENPQVVAFDPTGTGEFVVTNAGDNTLTVFAIGEDTGPGWLRGIVFADCPDPGTALHGVEVDVFVNGTGEMLSSLVTDETGLYEAEIDPGSYTVTLVTPLGYTIEYETLPLEVVSAETTSMDWSLVCQEIIPSPRRMSFWKHQLGVALRGTGRFEIGGPLLCDYLDMIQSHFNNHRLNQVVVYQPPESDECTDKLQVAKDLLNLDGDLDALSHARQELMALLFNVSSGKLGVTEIISRDGAPVSKAITYVDQLIDDGDPINDEKAMKIAKDINGGKLVNIGVIPDDLPDFSYQIVPRKFKLEQNYPNPFNPKATIKFEIARPGNVKLVIYDVAGRLVRTLVDEHRDPNRYVVVWDGTNNAGSRVSSGVYFCRMVAGSFDRTYKMLLLK